jgi:hypothetical protein
MARSRRSIGPFRFVGGPAFGRTIRPLIERIAATPWRQLKMDGIDFSHSFYWIDDAPLALEIACLAAENKVHRLIKISTDREPDALMRAQAILSEATANPQADDAAATPFF